MMEGWEEKGLQFLGDTLMVQTDFHVELVTMHSGVLEEIDDRQKDRQTEISHTIWISSHVILMSSCLAELVIYSNTVCTYL